MSNLKFVEKLANAPWLCAPEHVEFLHSIFVRYLDRTASGERFDPQSVEQAIGRPLDNTREVTVKNGVARIPVEGTIVRRASLFTEISGGVSTETLAKDFISAYNDATVHSILFVFDSPGGEAYGINELSSIIREKRDLGEKRIEAYCDGECASAAYWLASATSKITADAGATVGSIGTVVRVKNPEAVKVKTDLQFWNAQSPKKRVDPTTEMGREAIQEWINDLGDLFIRSVADNRGVSSEKVVSDFGQGFVMTGERALKAGMVDEVGSEGRVVSALIERERNPAALRPAALIGHEGTRILEARQVIGTHDKEEELGTQVEQDEAMAQGGTVAVDQPVVVGAGSQVVDTLPVENPQGVLDRIKGLLGLPMSAPAGATTADANADDVTEGEQAAANQREETDSGMTQGEGQQTTVEATDSEERSVATDTQQTGREDLATREELEALRAELETERARNAQTSAVLRERGIDRLLATMSTVTLENGTKGAMPKAQRDSAKVLIAALADAGDKHDPIELSASGEATIKDTPEGKAFGNLITHWKPVELGERGTVEGEPESEGPQGDHQRVLAELKDRGLGMDHYSAVAGELAANGEIRREG